MPVRHVIHHDLGLDLARKATRHALETYRRNLAEYQPRGHWTDDDHAVVEFTVLGKTMRGTVEVGEGQVALALDVPFLFRAFQGIAMQVVEKEIEMWLEKARNGELDDEE